MLSPATKFNVAQKTADELVAEHVRLKDKLAAAAKYFAELCQPDKNTMEEIEGRLMEMLNALGGDSLKTPKGTAYKSTIVTPKIVDREAYLDVVMDNYDSFGAGMLQLMAPKKEAIEDYMASNNGALPPGVETSAFTRLNIRRS